jgi:hypothetical protein
VVAAIKGNGDLWLFKVLGGGEWDRYDHPGCEFLLPPRLIRLGATIDVIDLFMNFGEVAIGFSGLFLLIVPFGHLEHLICETLESVIVLGLLLFLGVENANKIQEDFKFTRPEPLLLVASWPFHRVDRMIRFPLLVMALGRARLVCVARVLLFLLLSCVKGRLLSQGVLITNGEHCFWCLGVFHGKLMDQGWVPESLLEEHNNRLVVDLRGDVSLVAESLDEFSEGLSLLLDDVG